MRSWLRRTGCYTRTNIRSSVADNGQDCTRYVKSTTPTLPDAVGVHRSALQAPQAASLLHSTGMTSPDVTSTLGISHQRCCQSADNK